MKVAKIVGWAFALLNGASFVYEMVTHDNLVLGAINFVVFAGLCRVLMK